MNVINLRFELEIEAGAVCGGSIPTAVLLVPILTLASPEGAGQEGDRLNGCRRVLTSALERGIGRPPPAKNVLEMTVLIMLK